MFIFSFQLKGDWTNNLCLIFFQQSGQKHLVQNKFLVSESLVEIYKILVVNAWRKSESDMLSG